MFLIADISFLYVYNKKNNIRVFDTIVFPDKYYIW